MSLDLPGNMIEAPGMVAERVPHEHLAKQLGISDKTVREKRKQGMTDEQIAADAQINSPKHDPLRNKRDEVLPLLAASAPSDDISELQALRIRGERANTEAKELSLAQRRGRLVEVDVVAQVLSQAFRAFRDGVLGMADRLSPQVASISDPATIRRILYDDARQTLSNLERLTDDWMGKAEAAENHSSSDRTTEGTVAK